MRTQPPEASGQHNVVRFNELDVSSLIGDHLGDMARDNATQEVVEIPEAAAKGIRNPGVRELGQEIVAYSNILTPCLLVITLRMNKQLRICHHPKIKLPSFVAPG